MPRYKPSHRRVDPVDLGPAVYKAKRKTILAAIERTVREAEDPVGVTGIHPSLSADQDRRWTIADMQRDARLRLETLRALL
jgi:hypothetical protein